MNDLQQKMYADAIGDESTWPKSTDDPEVNVAVDRHVSDPTLPEWDNLPEDLKSIYIMEVQALGSLEGGAGLHKSDYVE